MKVPAPTIREALVYARARLSIRTDEAPIEAEVLLGHVLGQGRAFLHAHPERRLTEDESAALQRLIERRLRGEPLAYLVGRREFYGLDFLVDPRVLIPRPETELLVERALALAEGPPPVGPRWLVADVGTGSGAIAVSVAYHRPQALVYAVDLSAAALEVAALNTQRHGVADRVVLLRGDLLEPLPEPVHLALANLPYIGEESWAALPEEIAGHEPRSALWGGRDGLDFYRRLLGQAPARLLPQGRLVLEVDPAQVAPLRALAAQALGPKAGFRVWQDYAGRDRAVEIACP